MMITRRSMITGIERTLDLPVTQDQLDHYYLRGALLERAFPDLSSADREFIMSGITDKEWKQFMTVEDEEEDE